MASTDTSFVDVDAVPCFSRGLTSTLSLVLFTGAGLFILGTSCVCCVRGTSCCAPVYAPKKKFRDYSTKEVLARMWTINADEVTDECGSRASSYLQLQSDILWYLTFLSVIALGVLLPVYSTDESSSSGDVETCSFKKSTVANVGMPERMWAVVAVSALVCLTGHALLLKTGRRWLRQRMKFLARVSPATYSVFLREIPTTAQTDQQIFDFFDAIFPGDIFEVHVAHVHKQEAALLKTLANAEEWSGYYSAKVGDTLWERPRVRLLQYRFRPVDALFHYQEEAELCRNMLRARMAEGWTSTGTAFVTFRTAGVAAKARRGLTVNMPKDSRESGPLRSISELGSLGLGSLGGRASLRLREPAEPLVDLRKFAGAVEVLPAPDPRDVLWDNLSVGWMRRRTLRLMGYAITLILMLLWEIPLLVISGQQSGGRRDQVARTVFPVALLLLFKFFLPYILWAFASKEYFQLRTARDVAVMNRYFWFLLVNALLLPLVTRTSLAVPERVQEAFSNSPASDSATESPWSHIVRAVSTEGDFFVNYVLQNAFLMPVARLMQLGPLFGYLLSGRWRVRTIQQDWTDVTDYRAFEFYVEYADSLSIFAITMAFAVPCPMIVPAGWLYFLLKHCVDKYNIVFVHPKEYEAGGHSLGATIVYLRAAVIMAAVAIVPLVFVSSTTLQLVVLIALLWACVSVGFLYMRFAVVKRADRLNGMAHARIGRFGSSVLSLFEGAYVHPVMARIEELFAEEDHESSEQSSGAGTPPSEEEAMISAVEEARLISSRLLRDLDLEEHEASDTPQLFSPRRRRAVRGRPLLSEASPRSSFSSNSVQMPLGPHNTPDEGSDVGFPAVVASGGGAYVAPSLPAGEHARETPEERNNGGEEEEEEEPSGASAGVCSSSAGDPLGSGGGSAAR